MKYDWRPASVAYIDFETQSTHDLKQSTGRKYAMDPATRVLTCVIKVDGQIHRMGPYLTAADKEFLVAISQRRTLVAHNASFDAGIWEHCAKLPEATWFDTMNCARAGGLPGGLDDIGMSLFGEGKDKNGSRLIDMLCILKPGAKVPIVGPAHNLLMEYNVRDVELLEQVYDVVKGYGEPDVMTADRIINDRGVPVDAGMLDHLIELYRKNSEIYGEEFDKKSGGVNPRSPKQVQEWMQKSGFRVPEHKGKPSLSKASYKDFASNPHKYFVGGDSDDLAEANAAVEYMIGSLEARNVVVRVGEGKAKACKRALEPDGRIHDQLVYYGAGPGRWAGRGFQLQNLPHAAPNVESLHLYKPDYSEIQSLASASSEKLGRIVNCTDILNAMLRTLVRTDNLLVADYNGVEARCAAWVSGCSRMLDLYAADKSIYLDIGRHVFGREITKADQQEYTLAKALGLGCIYGLSGPKFYILNKDRDDLRLETFEAMGLTASDQVKQFRKMYPELPAIWRAYGEAVHNAVAGASSEVGKCFFCMDGRNLHIVLPSGRPIVYRNARIEPRVPAYCVLYGMPEEPIPTLIYDSARRGSEGFLYGSKVCENICQGTCRDILAHKLVEFEAAGFKVVFHVHDEIAAEMQESRFREFIEIMSTPPAWAHDFPLKVEGYSGPIWTKQHKTYFNLDALCGKVL